MRISGAETHQALRQISLGTPFVRVMRFPLLNHLIAARLVTCGHDDNWRLTERGVRSLRARKAVDHKREVAARARRLA